MNRKEIKEIAKEKIKGNKWLILKPLLFIALIEFVLGFIGGITGATDEGVYNILTIILGVCNVVVSIFTVTYSVYLLNFIRTGTASFKDMVECFKKNFVAIILVSILMTIFVFGWTLLLIVPGIIAAISYTWAPVLVVDKSMSIEAIGKSKRMMKGYKANYLVFELSFIGWHILAILTAGILYIWLLPYIEISRMLYYEKLLEWIIEHQK